MISQQLKVFLQVVDCGSFTKAASQLFVTPASIMKHMNTLESRLGVTLLKRNNQGISLTSAGEALYKDGKKIAAEAENAIFKAKNIERGEGTVIRIGSSLLNPSKVLTDLWLPFQEKYRQYRFSIVPYEDTKEQILSVTASLGERIDILIGSFNSKKMLETANYYPLGYYKFCIAVPKEHPLAKKKNLTLRDLHGERLMMVKSGDTEPIDHFHDMMKMTHPQILIEEADYYYDMETFNTCERTGALLLTLDAWADIHPFLITLPVSWDYKVPYGILYAKNPSEDVVEFIKIIKQQFGDNNSLN
ncbi:HTH-type transcriptional regulator CynR [Lachnospiraceae bacterium]|nr:HTH-type transcriptional regulator CynR [Lachnospiraceae bacterium]